MTVKLSEKLLKRINECIHEELIMGSINMNTVSIKCGLYPIFEIGQILYDQQDDKELIVLRCIEINDGSVTSIFYLTQTVSGALRMYGPKALGTGRDTRDKDIVVVDQACLVTKNERIANIKRTALAKLTDVEKEVLGLQ